MPQFNYKIINKKNKVVEGSISALNASRAKKKLERGGATILFINRSDNSFWNKISSLAWFGISQSERIAFFRNLAAMLIAGIQINDALRIIREQSRNRAMKKAISDMIADIQNGKQLSTAMAKFPNLFSPFLIDTVGVGEVTGNLTDTLDKISLDLEQQLELQREIKSQMAYPAIVILVMIVVVVILMVYVLPKIEDLFIELNVALPLPTRILVNIGKFIESYPLVILAAILSSLLLSFLIMKSRVGRGAIHHLILRMPLFGEITKESNLVVFFRALELLFASGVSFLRAVDVAKKTLKNSAYQKALDDMRPLLAQGRTISEALKPFPFLFPLQTQHMIEVGVRTGQLERSFKHVTSYYERSLRNRTKTMASLIEPVLMAVTGVIVGGIALSIFLPIYSTMYTIF